MVVPTNRQARDKTYKVKGGHWSHRFGGLRLHWLPSPIWINGQIMTNLYRFWSHDDDSYELFANFSKLYTQVWCFAVSGSRQRDSPVAKPMNVPSVTCFLGISLLGRWDKPCSFAISHEDQRRGRRDLNWTIMGQCRKSTKSALPEINSPSCSKNLHWWTRRMDACAKCGLSLYL